MPDATRTELDHDFVAPLADPGRERFWRDYLTLGFCIFAAESAAASLYLFLTPAGPNRSVLTTMATVVAIVALLCIAPVRWVATQRWRTGFSIAWSVAASMVLATCAGLDGGLESPLLYLSVLPVIYTALAMQPWQVGVVGASTAGGILGVGLSDHDRAIPQESLFMFAAFVAGVVTLAIVAAVHRSRLQSGEEALMQELADRSVTDGLTGCRNHRAFHERLAEEVARAIRHQRPLALILCDVDHFKRFNDQFGHATGDQTLAAIGARLRACARSTDVLARIGGDEFAILMPETTTEAATAVSARIVALAPAGPGPSVEATLSIGVAGLDPAEPTAKRLLRDADRAMFSAKALGRGQAVTAVSDVRRPRPPAQPTLLGTEA